MAVMLTALCSMGLFASANTSEGEDATYGTYNDGLNVGRSQLQNNYDPLEAPKNLDFSEGLKYWTNIEIAQGGANYASTAVELKTDEDDSYNYIKMKNNAENCGIVCWPFYLGDHVETGDYVAILFDWRGDEWDARIHLRQAGVAENWVTSNDATTLIEGTEENDNWNTAVNPASLACTVSTGSDDSLKLAKYVVYIQEISKDSPSDVEIRNIRVVKTNEDSSKFWDLETGEEITVSPTNPTDPADPYGTFEGGIDAGRNVINATWEKINGPHNLDFSEGLRYWTWMAPAGVTVTKTTEVGSIHKEDGYNYIKLNTANEQYVGFASYPFTLDGLAEEGDYLAIIYEWRGESSDFMVHMREERKGGQGDWVTDSYNTLYNAATTDDGWNTSVISAMKGLAASDQEPYYYIGIQTNTPLNDCDTEFRNLRLVRTNGLGEDSTKFWDLETGEEIVLVMDGEEPEVDDNNTDDTGNTGDAGNTGDTGNTGDAGNAGNAGNTGDTNSADTPNDSESPDTGVAMAVWPFVAAIAAGSGARLLRKKRF